MRLSKFTASLAAAAVLALAAGAAQAEPAIWVVKGPHATVYLFGTVHLLKPNAAWLTPKIQQAFDASGDLTLEIANIDDPNATQPFVKQLGFDPAHPLSKTLDAKDAAKLSAAETALHLDPAQVDPMRPWLAALTLTIAPMVEAGFDPDTGADRELKARADARHEPVLGFETGEQQLHLFADLPPAQEIGLLRESLDEYGDAVARADDLGKAWQAGDVARISKLVNEDMKQEDKALYALVLVDRNKAFARKIAERLKGDGVSFVAVGAGHLAGPDSVQAQLAKMGIKAERF